jgi:hypothetical protein
MSKIVLLYPPQQAEPEHGHKPEAALAYPYLAGHCSQPGMTCRAMTLVLAMIRSGGCLLVNDSAKWADSLRGIR